ncbi:MAG TPA: tRNA uridine-5-carboxymethylaminomethyl(34) synthesis GTPase MnmE [Candidatus Hydrogenedentes bacterium]|nr:tRNA uridine-5-carboxymethylaminomethyl(34) synthesis GTPase MnmE [Candidatus Hydrogenedentota bacterium]HOL75897.1 tRNA uridine-5-carboxymethylaminomethyl(34) synthesis GTPase MnmE [Candidatus Hydrogenedentota bacterium]HPO85694.1 tRNA uridine-5-carboxymethylaminomethyl(34) synthesis GTPase MnmE [Candidatus Hydrogenedentota bacterium]
MNLKKPEDTIAAIATAPGEAAIGIVRISGSKAIDIVAAIFVSSRQKDIRTHSGRVFHGEIVGEQGTIDEVLVHVMRAPFSYTREDVVEINCHGGTAALRAVLDLVLARGARLARPGEFTLRAFLNGRIDLVQAEAVIDRIRAQTDAALRAASAAAHGVLSRTIYELRDELAEALAHVEAAIDFPEEDLPELITEELKTKIVRCRARMWELLATANAGRVIREGARVSIVGKPNVGKSSLFNALLRDARAIVTSHPGTTRDLIEETVSLCGVPMRLIDTAGLRATEDEVERLGVQAAQSTLENADAVLFVIDAADSDRTHDAEIAETIIQRNVPALCVINKADLVRHVEIPPWTKEFAGTVSVSAKTRENLSLLEKQLTELLVGNVETVQTSAIVTRAHQRDSLRRASEALTRLLENFSASPEFLSIDLRESLHALGEITGETATDEILDRIFSSFCIGK